MRFGVKMSGVLKTRFDLGRTTLFERKSIAVTHLSEFDLRGRDSP